MNKRYEAGRRFEYKVIKHLTELGYYCVRSAGSHSLVDIIAIGKSDTMLVQCKKDGRIKPRDAAELVGLAVRDIPVLAKSVYGNVVLVDLREERCIMESCGS